MSGKRFSGQQAADWGLFTEAVPPEQLEERLEKYIQKYSNGPTKAYGNIKTLINRCVGTMGPLPEVPEPPAEE